MKDGFVVEEGLTDQVLNRPDPRVHPAADLVGARLTGEPDTVGYQAVQPPSTTTT